MVLINYAGREINAKIVYYGPGLSGKTTNLECIYASVPGDSRGKMVSMKTRQDRTLFFDFLPLELGEIHGFRTRFLLYTVPGQVFYNATRKLVLKGADAVVFVADSQLGKMEENQQSLQNLEENLRENNLTLDSIPWVIQYNKRDLQNVHSIEELQQALNPQGVPHFEAAAATGRGVYETLHSVSRLLFQRLRTELGRHANTGQARRPAAPEPSPMPAGEAPIMAGPSGITPRPNIAEATVTASRVMQRPDFPPAQPAPQQGPAASEARAAAEGGAYGDFGHMVDLPTEAGRAAQQQVPGAEGFIKDPMRRRDPSGEAQPPVAPQSAAQDVHVPVVLKHSDLKPGGTIRIVLDVRIEP
jgi:signal recognition particle receptor subunit beta